MANLKTRQTWKNIWDRLTAQISVNAIGESPMDSIPATITEPLTLYVDAAGSDAGTGSADSPLRTPQAALDYLKTAEVASPVVIQLGAGTFPSFYIPPLRILQGTTASVTVQGTLGNAVTGTCTAAVVEGTTVLTDATKTWTVDEHAGKLVTATVGATPTTLMCYGNTATELFLVSNTTNYTGYTIHSFDTLIQSSAMNGNTCAILSMTGPAYANGTQIAVSRVTNATQTGSSVIMRGGNLQLTQCSFRSSGNVISFFGGQLNTTGVALVGVGGSASALNCSSAATGAIALGTTCASLVNTGIAMLSPAVYSNINGCVFYKNTNVGINSQMGASMTLIGAFDKFVSCGTAISASAGSNILIGSTTPLVGSSNTTIFNITKGAACSIPSTATITGTTEISVDGATSTIAAMRLNSPKIFPLTINPYASYVYE